MNAKRIVIAIVSLGIGLGGLTVTMGGLIIHGQHILQQDVADLRERMARLEGMFEGHLNRETK